MVWLSPLKYYNLHIGSSLFDPEGYQLIDEILLSAEENNTKIHLPIDFKITNALTNDGPNKIVNIVEGIPDNWMGLDIGPRSIEKFKSIIKLSKTIIWNGPMGVFEFSNFMEGSYQISNQLKKSTT